MYSRCFAPVACGLLLVAGARADPQVRFHHQIWNANAGSFPGGPFQFEVISGLQPVGLGQYLTGHVGSAAQISAAQAAESRSFATFCLEYNEYINPGSQYNAQLATYSYYGGVSPSAPAGGFQPSYSGPGDPLDFRTAYLYDRFIRGTLDNAIPAFVYGASTSGQALQQAVWYIEGERTLTQIGGTGSLAYSLVQNANAAVTNPSIWGHTRGNVRVMNLTDNGGINKQSQLILIPLPSGPGMAAAGVVCLAGGRAARRRRRGGF